MPGICLIRSKSNLEIYFNDIYKTSVSSLFIKNTYSIKIYSFNYDYCLNYLKDEEKQLFAINLNKLVYHKDNFKLNISHQLVLLDLGTDYILEVNRKYNILN